MAGVILGGGSTTALFKNNEVAKKTPIPLAAAPPSSPTSARLTRFNCWKKASNSASVLSLSSIKATTFSSCMGGSKSRASSACWASSWPSSSSGAGGAISSKRCLNMLLRGAYFKGWGAGRVIVMVGANGSSPAVG